MQAGLSLAWSQTSEDRFSRDMAELCNVARLNTGDPGLIYFKVGLHFVCLFIFLLVCLKSAWSTFLGKSLSSDSSHVLCLVLFLDVPIVPHLMSWKEPSITRYNL